MGLTISSISFFEKIAIGIFIVGFVAGIIAGVVFPYNNSDRQYFKSKILGNF